MKSLLTLEQLDKRGMSNYAVYTYKLIFPKVVNGMELVKKKDMGRDFNITIDSMGKQIMKTVYITSVKKGHG